MTVSANNISEISYALPQQRVSGHGDASTKLLLKGGDNFQTSLTSVLMNSGALTSHPAHGNHLGVQGLLESAAFTQKSSFESSGGLMGRNGSASTVARENISLAIESVQKRRADGESGLKALESQTSVAKQDELNNLKSSELQKIQNLKALQARFEKWAEEMEQAASSGQVSEADLKVGVELLAELLALLGEGLGFTGGAAMGLNGLTGNPMGGVLKPSQDLTETLEMLKALKDRLGNGRQLGLGGSPGLLASNSEKTLTQFTKEALKLLETLTQPGAITGEVVNDLKTFLGQFQEALETILPQSESEKGWAEMREWLLRGGRPERAEQAGRTIVKGEGNPTHLQNGTPATSMTPQSQNLGQGSLQQGTGQGSQQGTGTAQQPPAPFSQFDNVLPKEVNPSLGLTGEKGASVKLVREYSPLASRLNPSVLLNKLVSNVKTAALGGREIFTLTLKPENLGSVSVLMKKVENQVTVKLIVENAVVKGMIEDQLSELKAQLVGEDIDLAKLEVDIDHSGADANAKADNFWKTLQDGMTGTDSYRDEVVELREASTDGASLQTGTRTLSLVI